MCWYDEFFKNLEAKIARYKKLYPEATFDLTNTDEVEKCFRVLQELTANPKLSSTSLAHINLLLNIPAVRAKAAEIKKPLMNAAMLFHPEACQAFKALPALKCQM